MSRQIVFKDDFDGKEIGKNPHITLMLSTGPGTGIALPINGAWKTVPLKSNWLHFRNAQTMGRYFAKQIREAANNNKVPLKK